jgi:tetratricopeptide (TPR) repeat protein
MKKTCFTVILVVIAALGTSVFAQTQGRARVRGVLTDEQTGEPIADATVRLFSLLANSYHNAALKTDHKGEWRALYLRSGMWNIEFEKPGYEPKKISERIVAETGAKIPVLEVSMRPIQGVQVTAGVVSDLEKGHALFNEGKYAEARQLLTTLFENNPDVFIIQSSIANCEFALENYEAALDLYMKVHKELPDSPDIIARIAATYNNWGRMDEALEWYGKIPPEDIPDVISAFNTGVLFYNNGKAEQALLYLKKSVAIDPEFGDGFYQVGLAYTALGKNIEAVEALKRFLELDPESPQADTAKGIIEALSKVKESENAAD